MLLIEAEKLNTTADQTDDISLFDEVKADENTVCSSEPEEPFDIFEYLEQCGMKRLGNRTIIVQSMKTHMI
jgi:hypothetical protein